MNDDSEYYSKLVSGDDHQKSLILENIVMGIGLKEFIGSLAIGMMS